MNYPILKFEPTGAEIRRTGVGVIDDEFPARVVDLVRNQDPWFLWVTFPNSVVVIREVTDIAKIETDAGHWWACQGFRPVSKEIALG